MEFEVLKKSHLTRNILIGVLVVGVISAVILNFTRAKYRVTQSIPLVNGTINYTPYDFKMVAMYQEDESGEYIEVEVMPSSGYVINEMESYCTVDNVNKDEEAILYTDDEGQHVIGNLKKGSKCYLYFDEQPSFKDSILTSSKVNDGIPNFNQIATTDEGMYKVEDNLGTSYYFRGAVENNYVKFAGFYWRIIRINGDGSIRIIYDGITAHANGEVSDDRQISTSRYNVHTNGRYYSYYVGYTYREGYQRPSTQNSGTASTIKEVLDNWYQEHMRSYDSQLVSTPGFCNDRSTDGPSWANSWQLEIDDPFYHSAYVRLSYNEEKQPTVKCFNNIDLYTTKIGLITADEVALAGGMYGEEYNWNTVSNSSFYLYTGQDYWTMSPGGQTSVNIISVREEGLFADSAISNIYGVRPVVNLRADVQISGSGTTSDPYTIS